MISNFHFLKNNNPFLYEHAAKCETNGITDPRVACMYARFTLEAVLKWMYENDEELNQPWENSLNAMLKEKSFRESTPPPILKKCELIRKNGNMAVHEQRKISTNTSLFIVESLFHVLYWFHRSYYDVDFEAEFNSALIPSGDNKNTPVKKVVIIKKKAEEEYTKHLSELEKKNLELEEELKIVRQKLRQNKREAQKLPDTHDYNEAETRKQFIDLLLFEAGWDIHNRDTVSEYELVGVERNRERTGKGFADYVLFGNDGLPLAVVEAKRTSVDAENGKHQAKDYANALEKKFGQRPIIFYSNGYNTFIWDDTFYPPEEIHGFYKKEELQRLINRRKTRVTDLSTIPADENIAGGNGRTYQKLAIKAVGEHLQKKHKRALIVMATGTGKTRTIIALIKQLQQANWSKRTLFLCDRISLLDQAKGAFTQNLPNTPAVDLRVDKTNTTARICLSTYGTMMGLINEVQKGNRLFGPGHFDLIVLDEAHRSIYQKYGAIFEYFDSLLVGLTATPKKEIDKNTYDLFRLQDDLPCYNYTLEEAVDAGHLVDFEAVNVVTGLSRNGLTYDHLSEEEKEEYEKHFSDEDTGELPDKIDSTALNHWLFNKDTVDSILKTLMEKGIKVNGGDTIGKTIIFARNKDHAKFIVDRFDENYPHHKGHFCNRIDYSLGVKDAGVLIKKFKTDSMPQIAVSVDMLDTGIDVPAVVNLVFAKPVYSVTKFWQMIGRGTRLCEDLFGPGEHKRGFKIFDCCENFAFFNMKPEGIVSGNTEPLSQKIFNRSLELAQELNTTDEEEGKMLRNEILDFLHSYVSHMEENNFLVRPALEYVRKYHLRESWDILDAGKVSEIHRTLSPLPSALDLGNQDAKQFDLLLLNTQLAFVEQNGLKFNKYKASIQKIAQNILSQLSNMPKVKKLLPFIQHIPGEPFWQGMNVAILEEIRKKLREFIQYIEKKDRKKVYSNFDDKIQLTETIDTSGFFPNELKKYREKMESILNKMLENNNTTLYKIRHNRQITKLDLEELDRQLFNASEEREMFFDVYQKRVMEKWKDLPDISLSLLIRSIIGLDKEDVEKAFSKFVSDTNYISTQYKFIQQIITLLTRDGFISPAALYEPPFTNLHHGGPDSVFGDETDELFDIIHSVNRKVTDVAV